MDRPVRIAVMASGRGSNFRALHEYLRGLPDAPAEIVLCLSNNPSPGAFDYAREQGIPAERISPKMFATEEEYSDRLLQLLASNGIELIVLAGYMRRLPPAVVAEFPDRILNIHPALLPEFGGPGMYGMHVHEAVIAAGRRESGASVHVVDEDYDTGRVIAQERVPIPEGTSAEELAAIVLDVEHRLLPRTVVAWAENLRRVWSEG